MNGRKKLVLSGASGFVGSSVARLFASRGWSVTALCRTRPHLTETEVTWQRYDLAGRPPPETVFEKADAFIHASVATDSRRNVIPVNLEGSRQLFELARHHGIPQRIFISSLAAGQRALSEYGKSKHLVELLVDPSCEAIVRPGMVIGNGGLFGRLVVFLRRCPVAPVFGDGKQPLQTVYIDDLVEAIFRIVERKLAGTFVVALAPIAYIDFYRLLYKKLGRSGKFLRVPFGLAELGLAIARWLHFPVPVTRESLLGLKQMTAYDATLDVGRLELTLHTLEQSIDLTLASARSQERRP